MRVILQQKYAEVLKATKALGPINPERYREYFKKGRVFRIVWPQPAGSTTQNDQSNANLTSTVDGQRTDSQIFWFIVVRSKAAHCLCVPIHTYGGLGVTKPGVDPDDHAVVVGVGKDHFTLPGERLTKTPIRVVVENKNITISPMSRVNFSKLYTVEYSTEVNNIGRIGPSDCQRLISHVKQAIFGSMDDTPHPQSQVPESGSIDEHMHEKGEKGKATMRDERKGVIKALPPTGEFTGWTWDAARQDWFFWNPAQLAWIYANGLVLYQKAASVADGDTTSNISNRKECRPLFSDQQQTAAEDTTNWTLPYGSGSIIGQLEDIIDAWLFRKGGGARGRTDGTIGENEELDFEYRVQRPGKQFYKIGKVFKVLYPETIGRPKDGVSAATDSGFGSEPLTSKIRWFVVVNPGRDCCSCLPITTYGRQGCGKAGILKWQHAIIYTREVEPAEQKSERPSPGEPSMMSAIRVRPASTLDKLDPLSRVNFAKIYTVEHNVKAYEFGDVHQDYLKTLRGQWEYVLNRNMEENVEEEDEDDDDDDGQLYAA